LVGQQAIQTGARAPVDIFDMSGGLVRLRIPAVSSSNLRPGLAAIRSLCPSPVSSPMKHVAPSASATTSASSAAGPESTTPQSDSAHANSGESATSARAGSVANPAPSSAKRNAESASPNPTKDSSASQGRAESAAATVSKWLWRGTAVAAGAAVAGGVATYSTDPEGSRETLQAFRQEVDEKVRFFTEPSREKLLPDPVLPFPGAQPLRTLVIDLDNTLVHSSYSRQFGWRVAKRPGAEAFLAYLSSLFEIVIFTDGLSTYADPILNKMDPNRYYISYRLYRAETKYERGSYIKDLSHLNRDLSRVILIDHDPKHYKYQPENSIHVPKWTDDSADTALLDLIPFLEDLVQDDCVDIREEIASLQGKPLKTALAEHRSLSSLRSERPLGGSRTSLFGSSPARGSVRHSAGSNAPAVQNSDVSAEDNNPHQNDAENEKNSSGGSLLAHASKKGRTSIFRPSL
jgi:Dullard-like phosphatase family protein